MQPLDLSIGGRFRVAGANSFTSSGGLVAWADCIHPPGRELAEGGIGIRGLCRPRSFPLRESPCRCTMPAHSFMGQPPASGLSDQAAHSYRRAAGGPGAGAFTFWPAGLAMRFRSPSLEKRVCIPGRRRQKMAGHIETAMLRPALRPNEVNRTPFSRGGVHYRCATSSRASSGPAGLEPAISAWSDHSRAAAGRQIQWRGTPGMRGGHQEREAPTRDFFGLDCQ